MRKLVSVLSATFLLLASAASAQVVMRQTAAGDGVFHLKEVQAIITSANDSVKVLMVLPTNMRPEGYRDIEIQNDDEILMVNKKRIKSVKTLEKMYNDLEVGDAFKMGVRRDGKLSLVSFKKIDPADLPADQHVQVRTVTDEGGGSGDGMIMTRTISVDGEGGNIRPLFGTGLMLGEQGDKVTIIDVMGHMGQVLGKVDIKVGDVIESLNGTKAKSLDQIVAVYEKFAVGKKVELAYRRKDKRMVASFVKPETQGRMIVR